MLIQENFKHHQSIKAKLIAEFLYEQKDFQEIVPYQTFLFIEI